MKARLAEAVAALVVFGGAVGLGAQWETPGRSFHNATSFPLEGRHLIVACESCHVAGVYKGTPNTCVACHWIRRRDDRYALRLGSQCEQCHRPTAWTPARWDHGTMTGMPLGSAHRLLGCDTCHSGGEFRGTNAACVSCHRQDYDRTREPNHAAAGFPVTCDTCHQASDAGFDRARFDHQAAYPLVGRHAAADCASCHRGTVYRGTPRDCVACHRADYDRTRAPGHAQAGFSTACETCHRPTDADWRGGRFNHALVFPLVGDHARQSCAACHAGGRYNATPRNCVGCHRASYDRTREPDHRAAGFPTSCESCHRASDASWSQGRFTHTQFPLRGPHATDCRSCHVETGNLRHFSCTVCHTRGETDEEHRERPGYRYDSRACYACHPNGKGDD